MDGRHFLCRLWRRKPDDRASPEGKQANLASLELRQPPGLTALGAKGSVRDRLTPPGRVEGSALGSYIVSLRWRGGRPSGAIFYAAFGGWVNAFCCAYHLR